MLMGHSCVCLCVLTGHLSIVYEEGEHDTDVSLSLPLPWHTAPHSRARFTLVLMLPTLVRLCSSVKILFVAVK